MTRAEDLRAEAERLRRRADVLVRVAEVIESVHAACDTCRCPNGPCLDCPAHVGQPGICLFVRLQGVVDTYLSKTDKQRKRPDPIIEVD